MSERGTRVYENHRARWLEDLVHMNGWTRGVEIGVFKGPTFKHLIENCPNLHLTGVDVFYPDKDWRRKRITTTQELNKQPATKWYPGLLEFCKQYPDRATLWRDFSNKAHKRVEDESIDFVFIDASHDYDSVYEDIKYWAPKVKKGGIVAGHDIDFLSVRMAVQSHRVKYEETYDNVWFYEK